MSDALEKVRGVRELPLFPLPLVLFPGVPLPLHIFEERYRRMLADVRVSNNLFGLSYFDPNSGEGERPTVGHVGCATEVVEAQQLPDGRSNILTLGLVRYRLAEYVERGDPYLVGRVEFFEDDEEDPRLLAKRAREVTEVFMRIARAMRAISDERGQLPELPEGEPERLSFLVAAVVEMDAEAKQQLLELHSTTERLRRLYALLKQAVGPYESRARTHDLAKGNGHAGRPVGFE
ncbi:MAG TPA: LON peptidase substrate-binding domain-containing protein [Pyrinomonadaceae bacterium]|nr:LON peptidase substrate-binding domain-containing protein [Pyrinomonadaceae bacterium]